MQICISALPVPSRARAREVPQTANLQFEMVPSRARAGEVNFHHWGKLKIVPSRARAREVML